MRKSDTNDNVKLSEEGSHTPQSSKISKKDLDLKRLKSIITEAHIKFKAYVVGFCGGDCAGKKQMINYLFQTSQSTQNKWSLQNSSEKGQQQVAVLYQYFFLKDPTHKYQSIGYDWTLFYKTALNLVIGNQVSIKNPLIKIDFTIKPAKLLVIQGCHIFNEVSSEIAPLYNMINTKIFIDSDADVRLSRRIYKDTQDDLIPLDNSIQNYLEHIKISYQKQIQPCKVKSDIILPHFGGGYDDHRKKNKKDYESNIKNAGALITAHLKEQMKLYEEDNIQIAQTQDML